MIYATYGASALGLLILLWAGASVAYKVFKNPMFWFALSLVSNNKQLKFFDCELL